MGVGVLVGGAEAAVWAALAVADLAAVLSVMSNGQQRLVLVVFQVKSRRDAVEVAGTEADGQRAVSAAPGVLVGGVQTQGQGVAPSLGDQRKLGKNQDVLVLGVVAPGAVQEAQV